MTNKWRPIDTAPTDGTDFLAYLTNRRVVILCASIGVKRNSPYSWWSMGLGIAIPYEKSHKNVDWDELTVRATHWMPLPDDPE